MHSHQMVQHSALSVLVASKLLDTTVFQDKNLATSVAVTRKTVAKFPKLLTGTLAYRQEPKGTKVSVGHSSVREGVKQILIDSQ